MPTPHESTAVLSTPQPRPLISPRASFTSCPPEEEREAHVTWQTRPESSQSATVEAHSEEPVAAVDQQPTLDSFTPANEATSLLREQEPQPEHGEGEGEAEADAEAEVEETGTVVSETASSPDGSLDAPSDSGSDGRLAQSMARTALESRDLEDDDSELPLYISYAPESKDRLQPHSTSSFLRPGSKFRGTQRSDRQVYDVQVEIKDVDLAESFVCGYLRIQGLTDDHPTLTTFFEGEIIGPKYLFRTTHASWNSSEKIDLQHWARFPAFRPLARSAKANPSTFTLKNYLEREHLFMRWKEYFLVPDHRVKSISGASFEGFYYICFDQCAGSVSGIYFHAKSEKYQQLELRHVPDGGCMGAVEFR